MVAAANQRGWECHFLSHPRGQQSPSEQPGGPAPELRLGSATSSGLCLSSVISPSLVTTELLGDCKAGGSVCLLALGAQSWGLWTVTSRVLQVVPNSRPSIPGEAPPLVTSHVVSPAGLWDLSEERASPSVYWSAASRVTGQWDQGDWLVPVSGKTFSFQGQLPMSRGCARTPEPALEDSLGKCSSLGHGLRGGKLGRACPRPEASRFSGQPNLQRR